MKPQAVHTIASLKARTEEIGDCWVWQGYSCNNAPYLDYQGRMTSVRKVLAILQGREIKEGVYFAVNCGTPGCVCPDHIIQRSRKAHMKVMAKGANTGAVKTQRMLKMTQTRRKTVAKLDMDKAREIRASIESGPVLAERYGVTRELINRIRRGVQWKDTASPFSGLGARA